ncbi:CoA transferase [uncultured Sphingomonas sp.]|uniref:CoA transferase n=1 Tax=uncultured Sphingomonas sp. TaxID=158754 RepID=UPI0035CA17DB
MYQLLTGIRVVEASSFVACPSAGLYMAQLGAEVIRIDQIGGGPDFHRWPQDANGASLYWEGLNKGKKSVALDLGRPEGREVAQRLATASGPGGGCFLTNYPVAGFLSHERLRTLRADLVTVRVMGLADGGSALDYTVNCAVGVPHMTGPASLGEQPVNHVLPAWDLLTGAYAAFALLAAARARADDGLDREVRVPLMDMAAATLSNLGQVAEVMLSGADRPRYGNDVFGAFGRDYVTACGSRIMLMAITPRQWSGLVEALSIEAVVADVEAVRGISFATDEGLRFTHRDVLVPIVASAVAARRLDALVPAFDRLGVCWGPYRSLTEALAADGPFVAPLFADIDHPSGHRYPAAGAPATLPAAERQAPRRAPRLGEHGEEVLADLLGMDSSEIGRLHDAGIVAFA